MARKALEVDVNKRKATKDEIIMREGFEIILGGGYKGVNPVGTIAIGSVTGNFNISKRAVDAKVNLTAFGDICQIAVSFKTDSSQYFQTGFSNTFLANGGTLEVNLKDYILGPLVAVGSVYGGDGVTPIAIGTISSYKLITNDFNWNADRTIGWQGDSISEPTVNPNLTLNDMHHFRTRNWLIDNSPEKKSYRLTICAVGGRTSASYVSLLNAGSAGSLPVDLSIDFYQYGMNDFDKMTTDAYKTNIRKWVDHRRRNYPGIVLVLLGTTPRMDDDKEAGVNIFRVAMGELILDLKEEWSEMGLNPERIIGIDLARTFDRKIRDNYAITDGGPDITDATHPGNATANHGMATKITEGYDYTSDTELGINFPTEEHPEGLLPPGGLRQRNIFELLK